ncbi:MAG TPA: YegS/Rv2252/BmrU family lipid kinase [Candidatus Rubrimentiphilum sp.]|nr:YegS/Rv2252/BmrU family lipid kinase [Candidatus Rubrimentiphilum sp.]
MQSYARLLDELPRRGVHIIAAHTVRKRKDLRRTIAQAVKNGAGVIAVVGGDGTQTAAVAELAHTQATLAVVPGGTGNSFALSLGIDSFERAMDAIVSGKERQVDVGVVNGTRFANFATIGLFAQAADDTSKPLKRILGPIAYGIAVLRGLPRAKPFRIRVYRQGGELDFCTHQAIVASGRFFGWQALTPDASVYDEKLAFFAAEGASDGDVLKTNAALLRGDQTQLEGAHYFSAKAIDIRTKPRQPLNIDGHAAGKTPAKFKVEPRALRVLVP